MNIADLIEKSLSNLSASHPGISSLSSYDRIKNSVEKMNSLISKCGAYVNGEEISSDELQGLKIKMPNLRPVVTYRICTASMDDISKLSIFSLEVSD